MYDKENKRNSDTRAVCRKTLSTKIKRVLFVVLAAIMSMGSLTACGGGGDMEMPLISKKTTKRSSGGAAGGGATHASKKSKNGSKDEISDVKNKEDYWSPEIGDN